MMELEMMPSLLFAENLRARSSLVKAPLSHSS